MEEKNKRPIPKSLKEYGRGITGGLLFSFPVLFTMEVWWAGFSATALQLFLLMLVTYLLLLGYNRYAGMRAGTTWRSILIDSVEEMGIGIMLSFFVMLVLNRISPGNMTLDEIMGKTIIEAMAVSIGVSVGTAQLGGNGHDESQKQEEHATESWWAARQSLIVLGFCGAIIVGGNVAPTEEVVMLAIEARPTHILLMAVLSLGISLITVFFSDFKGSARNGGRHSLFDITLDTCLSYIIALIASAMCLWFFGRLQHVNFYVGLSQCVVLGVIASLGASAGRLLIK